MDDIFKTLGLPPDAFQSGLNEKEILQVVADAQYLGEEGWYKKTDFWQNLKNNGRNSVMVAIIKRKHKIPINVMKNASPTDLLNAISVFQHMSLSTSNISAWNDYEKMISGSISKENFISRWIK